MAIPVVYNVRSVKARWTSTIVAVVGIAGTVGVFVAMLSLARIQGHACFLRLRGQCAHYPRRGDIRNDQWSFYRFSQDYPGRSGDRAGGRRPFADTGGCLDGAHSVALHRHRCQR